MNSYVTNTTKIPHPFYPIETELVGYLANDWSVPTLLGVFAAGWVVILSLTMALVKRHNPGLPVGERATIMWFVLCTYINSVALLGNTDSHVAGTIHFFFEGQRPS